LLNQNQYWSAALSLVQFLIAHPPAPDAEADAEADAGGEAIEPPMIFTFLPRTIEGIFPEIFASFSTVREKTVPPTVESLRVSSIRELILAKGIRWIIASVGIVIIGYVLFASKFVGTFPDLLAIFVWAFGVDISVDALLDAGKKLKQS
jgi:hypothetical protein